MERDLEANPYTPHEQRVVEYLAELTDIASDDPVEFLIASHEVLRNRLKTANDDAGALGDRVDELEEAHYKILSWSRAYPLDVFPEPDLVKARQLLEAGGVSLDAISAHCMRHVVEGVGQISKEVLEP